MGQEYTRSLTTLGLLPISGSVLFYDNFECLLHFTRFGTSGDYIFELDPSIAFSGSQSLNTKTRTTGTAPGDNINASLLSHLSPAKILTHTVRLLSPDFTKIDVLQIMHHFYDGTDINTASIYFYPNTPVWKYLDSSNAEQSIANSGFNLFNDGWHLLTLKINYLTGKYLSLTIDDVIFDLSTYAIYINTNPTLRHLDSQCYFKTIGAAPAQLRLDEFSLTEH
ncbi:hypothetical protein ES705_33238 [subsurface metagenome]